MPYHFNSSVCTIEIEDKKYPVPITAKLTDNVRRSKDMIDGIRGCNDGGKIVSAADSAIDIILGEGCSAEIFAGREPSAFERLDVLTYIYSEMTAFTEKRAGDRNVLPKEKYHNRKNRNRGHKNSH